MHAPYDDPGTPGLDTAPSTYITDRLDLAAWLVCQGFALQRLDPPAPSAPRPHARFVFPATEELSEAVSAWERGQPIHGTDLRRFVSVKKDLFARARRVVEKEQVR